MKYATNPKLSELSARYIEHLAISVTPISSRLAYKRRLEKHVLPVIGGLRLKELQRTDVENLIAELSRKGVSPATIRLAKNALHRVLGYAVDLGLVDRNVSSGVKLPKAIKYQPRIYAQNEINCLLEVAKETVLYIPVLIAVNTGLRRTEILSLRWRNISIAEQKIVISKRNRPKTGRGIRVIPVPIEVIRALKKHKSLQRENPAKRRGVENSWGYVVSKPDGSPYNSSYISRCFGELLKDNGLPHIRFHDLRHAYATHAHFAGMPIKELARILGHNSAATSLDTYVHDKDECPR